MCDSLDSMEVASMGSPIQVFPSVVVKLLKGHQVWRGGGGSKAEISWPQKDCFLHLCRD